MIGEIDRNTLRALVQRDGIDQVLLVLAEVCQSLPPDQLAGEAIARELIAAIKPAPAVAERAPITGPRIVSAEPPKRKVIVGRPEPGPTRIVSAKPPPRAPRRK